MDASEIHARKLKVKEIIVSKKDEKIIFPFADGTAKLCGRDHEIRESNVWQFHPAGRMISKENFKETRMGLNRQTKQKVTLKPETILGQSKGTPSIVITMNLSTPCAERRNIPYPTEIH